MMDTLFAVAPEVSPSAEWCQRWKGGTHSWRHRADGGFRAEDFEVGPLDHKTARGYVLENHYAGTWPSVSLAYGLRVVATGQLVGVAALGTPVGANVLTNVFPDMGPWSVEHPAGALDLSRFVLADAVAANGETWFLGQLFAAIAARGVAGVVAFADPVPRLVDGRFVFLGHRGTIYCAKGAVYTGRATPRTLTVLPNGQVFSARAAQKVRKDERGHHYVEEQLVRLGARRRSNEPGAVWLAQALADIRPTLVRHGGNHRYAFRLGVTPRSRARVVIGPAELPYPK